MCYETFQETVRQLLEARLDPGCSVRIQSVPKNNGALMDGLCMESPRVSITPTIYLNPYYEQFCHGMTMEEIVEDILQIFQSDLLTACVPPEQADSFSSLRDKVMFKVIHASSNREALQTIPHVDFLDLAIIFYLFFDQNSSGQMTALISNEHLDFWNITADDLLALARVNTPRVFPAQIRSLSSVMEELFPEEMAEDAKTAVLNEIDLEGTDMEETFPEEDGVPMPLYILSNPYGINGASCMLYDGALKNFAEQAGSDLLILPSSIHEVLLTPDSPQISCEELSLLVTSINLNEVPKEDRLSNQIYRYLRSEDRIEFASQHTSILERIPLYS